MTNFYRIGVQPEYIQRYGFPFGESNYGTKCGVCSRLRGEPIPPVAIRFEKRITTADFVFTSTEVLAVDAVRQVFEVENVTGVEYLDVKVRITETEEKLRTTLWHLHIIGRAYAAPETNIVPIDHCPACSITVYSTWDDGLLIDENRWDGSDFLRLYERVGGIIVTEKVRNIIEREGFTGVIFTPVQEYRDPFPESRPRPK